MQATELSFQFGERFVATVENRQWIGIDQDGRDVVPCGYLSSAEIQHLRVLPRLLFRGPRDKVFHAHVVVESVAGNRSDGSSDQEEGEEEEVDIEGAEADAEGIEGVEPEAEVELAGAEVESSPPDEATDSNSIAADFRSSAADFCNARKALSALVPLTKLAGSQMSSLAGYDTLY